jgi:uncharacterized protein YeaO (DUF488 family)
MNKNSTIRSAQVTKNDEFYTQTKDIEKELQYYVKHFNDEVLANLSPHQVVSDFHYLSKGKDVVMLCYEKSDDFCHRHLVAEWLTNAGYPVEEMTF